MCMRLLASMGAGAYKMHCCAAEATLFMESAGAVLGALAVSSPLLVLTDSALVVLAPNASHATAWLHLKGAQLFSCCLLHDAGCNILYSFCAVSQALLPALVSKYIALLQVRRCGSARVSGSCI